MLGVVRAIGSYLRALRPALAGLIGLAAGSALPGCQAPETLSLEELIEAIEAIDGMTRVDTSVEPESRYRYVEVRFEQPVNHSKPDGDVFLQRIGMLLHDPQAPVLFRTAGYTLRYPEIPREPTLLLDGNEISVEHRFFGSSRPEDANWKRLNISQASHDLHRIVEVLEPLLPGAWISTGFSKGGETALIHRAHYPHDVDATLAYVAPFNHDFPDDGYADALELAPLPDCRERLRQFQTAALSNRDRIAGMFEEMHGEIYTRLGSDRAVETMVVEAEWTFWQYYSHEECGEVPSPSDPPSAFFDYLDEMYGNSFTDPDLDAYGPYIHQVLSQLGHPEVAFSHIEDSLLFDYYDFEALLPPGTDPSYNPEPLERVADWARRHGSEIMLVYGEYDPWTNGAVDIRGSRDAHSYTVPKVGHWAGLRLLRRGEMQTAFDVLERWTGVTPSLDLIPRSATLDAREFRNLYAPR